MAKTAVYDYSTTASSNSDFDGTDSSGATGKVKDGDNYARSIASHVKGFALDLGAVNTVGGTADAITVTLSSAPSALVDGMRITINASAANTGATTLNVTPAGGSAFGAKKVMKWSAGSEAELSANDIPAANALIELVYDSARNAAAGAWMLLGTSVAAATTTAAGISELLTTTELLTGTDTTRAATADSIAALWEKGSDEASAGTVAFGEGGFFHITGTTTITDLDFDTAKDGRAVDVVFDGALTLTHNGTTLQLPGGANITTAAGDRARFVQDSSDNIICLWYQRTNGGLPSTDGAAPAYVCRAWVNYNQATPGVRGSGNVSSVTDNSAGNLTVNFTTAIADANYSVNANIEYSGATASTMSRAAQVPNGGRATTTLNVVTGQVSAVLEDQIGVFITVVR